MCTYAMWTGLHASEVGRFAQTAEAMGETLRDLPLQVAGQYYRCLAGLISGDYRSVHDHGQRLLESLPGDLSLERLGLAVFPAVMSRVCMARTLAERGLFDEGRDHGREAIRISETLDHPFSLIWACMGLAHLDGVKGEWGQAAGLVERAVALGRDWNITTYNPIALASLGHLYAWSGRIEEGLSWLQQALTASESTGTGFLQSIGVVQLGEAYLLADRGESARASADRALRLARQRGERGHEAWALHLLGEIAAHPDHPDVATAEAHHGATLALADELGMRPLAAHCHLGLGNLYRRTGDGARAQAHLATTRAMYREMNMGFWLEKVEAEMAALR
jgi:tetratricopeptide (TPR) repeat protein